MIQGHEVKEETKYVLYPLIFFVNPPIFYAKELKPIASTVASISQR